MNYKRHAQSEFVDILDDLWTLEKIDVGVAVGELEGQVPSVRGCCDTNLLSLFKNTLFLVTKTGIQNCGQIVDKLWTLVDA